MAIIDLYQGNNKEEEKEKEKNVAPKKENSGMKPLQFSDPKEHIFTYKLDYSNEPPIFSEIKKKVKILAGLDLNSDQDEPTPQPKPLNDIRPEELKTENAEALVEKIALDPEDIDLTAEIIVEVIDMIVSGVCRWIAKDTSDSSYILSPRRMERLKNAIVKYMKTVKVASSPLGMLIVLLLIIMLTPMMKAFKARKKNKNKVVNIDNTPKADEYEEAEVIDEEISWDDINLPMRKSA